MVYLAMGLLLAAGVQPETVTRGGLNWTPSEATVGDMNPLATSSRAMPVDMRLGSNFDRLYKLEGRPRLFGGSAEQDYYMRMNGGVTAVFPRSAYSLRKGGVLAEIPAGTVYSIGGNLSQLVNVGPMSQAAGQPGPQQPRPGSNFIDRSARPVAPAPNIQPEPAPRSDNAAPSDGTGAMATVGESARSDDRPVQSIWWDEAFRQQRVGALLDQALAKK
jgi:hypothetical protein